MSERFDDKIISDFKAKMIRKAKKNGLAENFGKKEIEAMKKKFGYNYYGDIDEQVNAEIIDDLEKWCNNLDTRDLK